MGYILLGAFAWFVVWLLYVLVTTVAIRLPLLTMLGVIIVWWAVVKWDSLSFEDQKAEFRSYARLERVNRGHRRRRRRDNEMGRSS